VNPAAEHILSRTDLVGKRLLLEMPGNRVEGLFNAHVQVMETGKVPAVEHLGSGAGFCRLEGGGREAWAI
jgi:hypothetical protein